MDQDFSTWLSDRWPRLSPTLPGLAIDLLSDKLRYLKKDVKVWIKDRCSLMDAGSKRLDLEINVLLSNSSFGILSQEEQSSLSQLRTEKKNILEHHLLNW